ncbi:MAG: FtsQ-type POTRA domain-containing protein [Ruminococcaceae bacterium]|nr:FtsQ-type POTRA domain-containing protein [Oscillospiraceae bacterium]
MKKGKSLEELKELREKRRARLKIMYIFLALVLVLAGGYLLATRYFVINEIIVSENEFYTAQDIISASGLKKGESIFTCNNGKLEKRLYSVRPYISSVRVSKHFPDAVEIKFEVQNGAMYLPILHETYALNRDMKVLGKVKADTPKAELRTSGVRRCIVGETAEFSDKDDGDIIKRIYGELFKAGVQDEISFIDVTDKFNIVFNYGNRFDVYIGDDELLDFKIKIFEKVIVDFPNDTGKITISENGRAVINLDDF